MVKIRLKRLGRKKRPFFRIVVVDVRTRRQGAPLEELGYFNPLSRELKLDKTKAETWIGKGAIPTPTVLRLLGQAPETGEVIVLEKARTEQLSKKAQERLKNAENEKKAAAEAAEAEKKAKAEAAAAEKEAAAAAAAAPPPPAPEPEPEPQPEPETAAAAESPVAEAPAEEAPAAE